MTEPAYELLTDPGARVSIKAWTRGVPLEAEARQQLAMVQLRAVEHGRPALMASTVGVSAFVDETGNVYDATPFNAPALISREVHLGTSRTIATRVGPMPELALAVVAIGVLAVAVVQRRSRRKEAH